MEGGEDHVKATVSATSVTDETQRDRVRRCLHHLVRDRKPALTLPVQVWTKN